MTVIWIVFLGYLENQGILFHFDKITIMNASFLLRCKRKEEMQKNGILNICITTALHLAWSEAASLQ